MDLVESLLAVLYALVRWRVVLCAVGGGLLGWLATSALGGDNWLILAFAVFGLILDIIFSANYKTLKKKGLPTSWRSSRGGFWSGGHSSGGGFGGFGGGRSGGGGASGSW